MSWVNCISWKKFLIWPVKSRTAGKDHFVFFRFKYTGWCIKNGPPVTNLFNKQVFFNISALFGKISKETNKGDISLTIWRLLYLLKNRYKIDLEYYIHKQHFLILWTFQVSRNIISFSLQCVTIEFRQNPVYVVNEQYSNCPDWFLKYVATTHFF